MRGRLGAGQLCTADYVFGLLGARAKFLIFEKTFAQNFFLIFAIPTFSFIFTFFFIFISLFCRLLALITLITIHCLEKINQALKIVRTISTSWKLQAHKVCQLGQDVCSAGNTFEKIAEGCRWELKARNSAVQLCAYLTWATMWNIIGAAGLVVVMAT